MKNKFQHHLQNKLQLIPFEKVIIAVSGGMDSMCLLDLANDFFDKVLVLHCNYNLRGEESDKDQQLVESYCKDHNIEYLINSFDTRRIIEENGGSIQETARSLRYDWFRKIKQERGFDWILTAHHKDDNYETLLIHLGRGSGIDGLIGIPEKTEDTCRPLLFFSKEELKKYAEQKAVPFRNDSSNFKDDYTRNAIRLNVIPTWEKASPNLKKGLDISLEHLKEQKVFIDKQVGKLQDKIIQNDSISFDNLLNEDSYLISLLLKRKGFNESDQKDLIKCIENKSIGSIINGSKEQALIDREVIHFKRLESNQVLSVLINQDDDKIEFNSKSIELNVVDNYKPSTNSFIEGFDLSRLTFPLEISKWKEGEYFYPLGMKGKKKISNFLIDRKINRFDKEDVLVLRSNGEVVWVIGYRIDDRFKIGKETKKVYLVNVNKSND